MPEWLKMEETTGEIDVNKSESGLKIKFLSLLTDQTISNSLYYNFGINIRTNI